MQIRNWMKGGLLKKKLGLKSTKAKLFQKCFILLQISDHFKHLSYPYYSWIFLKIILFFKVDIFCQDNLSFLRTSLNPMINIS